MTMPATVMTSALTPVRRRASPTGRRPASIGLRRLPSNMRVHLGWPGSAGRACWSLAIGVARTVRRSSRSPTSAVADLSSWSLRSRRRLSSPHGSLHVLEPLGRRRRRRAALARPPLPGVVPPRRAGRRDTSPPTWGRRRRAGGPSPSSSSTGGLRARRPAGRDRAGAVHDDPELPADLLDRAERDSRGSRHGGVGGHARRPRSTACATPPRGSPTGPSTSR